MEEYAQQFSAPASTSGEGEESGLHIWNAIDGDWAEVDNLKEAKKWVKENYCDPEDGIHPDIETIEIFKKVAGVALVPVPGKNTFKIEVQPVASTPSVNEGREAIAVLEWIKGNGYETVLHNAERKWCTWEVAEYGSSNEKDYMTSTDLYAIFKQSSEK